MSRNASAPTSPVARTPASPSDAAHFQSQSPQRLQQPAQQPARPAPARPPHAAADGEPDDFERWAAYKQYPAATAACGGEPAPNNRPMTMADRERSRRPARSFAGAPVSPAAGAGPPRLSTADGPGGGSFNRFARAPEGGAAGGGRGDVRLVNRDGQGYEWEAAADDDGRPHTRGAQGGRPYSRGGLAGADYSRPHTSGSEGGGWGGGGAAGAGRGARAGTGQVGGGRGPGKADGADRKSTRLNSSH